MSGTKAMTCCCPATLQILSKTAFSLICMIADAVHWCMMQTAADNVARLEESEAKLRERVKALNLDRLEEDEEAVQAQGTCNVTLQTYVEALRDVDCMCLGLDVSRPEAAIAGELL